MGSSFEEFAHRKDASYPHSHPSHPRQSPRSTNKGHSAFEFPPRHHHHHPPHHEVHVTKVACADAGTGTDSPIDTHRSFRYEPSPRTSYVASTQFGSTTTTSSQTSMSDDEKDHHSKSSTRTKNIN